MSVSPDDSADDAPGGPDPGPPGHDPPDPLPGHPGASAGAHDQASDASPRSYLDQPVGEFLGSLSAGHAAPGGGSAAALTVALGASLCAMAARLSAQQLSVLDIEFLVTEAEALRGSAASMVQADAESYRKVVAALRDRPGPDPGAPGQDPDPDPDPDPEAGHRRPQIAAALAEAATVPMEVLELAAQTARLAARLAVDGNPRLRGDAITAALLAEAGARAAAVLISINLAALPGDHRLARAQALLSEVTSAVRAAEG